MAASLARVALITGAAQGIGRATANKLASRGVSVVFADMNEDKGQQAAKDVAQKWNVPTKFVKVDITQEQQVKDMIGQALKLTGRLDYSANCAGICESAWAEEESITVEQFDKTHAINTRGLWLCQKHQALQMRTQEPRTVSFNPPSQHPIQGQRGAIANVCSISGLHAAGLAAYTASKYAAIGVTKTGAKFYGPDGIRINGLCPGWTLTEMVVGSMGKEGTIGTKENAESPTAKRISLRRMALPEEQANVLGFMLSDESSYLHGALIVNDGGFHDIR